MAEAPKRIAAIITSFWRMSHAEVIVGRLLEGYYYQGERQHPRVKIVSMYVDQFPENDMSREIAAKHNIPIHASIEAALQMGGEDLAVDGVVIIGEHGVYPFNIKGQEIYPRYHFYRQVVDVFRKSGRCVPVFCDKHLSHDWDEARWMYDMSISMGFPLMAGSSLPVAWRKPELELELETPVTHAVVVNHGEKERYGIHTLEALQCMVERRQGGETGVSTVQCIEGDVVWTWTDDHDWASQLLTAAIARCPEAEGDLREQTPAPILFIIEYRSGLRAACYLLNGYIKSAAFAARVHGSDGPVTTAFEVQARPYAHVSGLVYHTEEMMLSGRSSWPVERVLLATGMLAAAFDSTYRHGNTIPHGRVVETPHLGIAYRATAASVFQRGPKPDVDPDFGIGP
ncbi:MAG: hypothetical protein HN712_04420 [Gemmatimonadetes bacterium]|nr:hypothetical protein [Gemmatimonadota bacterium]MBT6144029.1 hypothetical protein [Gemmatimonadota bacterium]MBT7859529.1 hypothetical protein [Gemmatimonadota bacterium]